MTEQNKEIIIGEGGVLSQTQKDSAAQQPGSTASETDWQDLLEIQQELYRNRDRLGGPDHNC